MSVLRVGLLGYGSIGSTVGEALRNGATPGIALTCALGSHAPHDVAVSTLEELLASSDVILECANPQALRLAVPRVLREGRTLVALSVGAFLDDDLWPTLWETHPGHLVMCPGAIGGIDLIRSMQLHGPMTSVALHTTKKPTALIQPWMSQEQVHALDGMTPSDPPRVVFSGATTEAAQLFPRNLNVAASLAIAVRDRGLVEVELTADASLEQTRHRISASSPSGSVSVMCEGTPSTGNPATSAIVPYAALRTLMDLRDVGPSRFG